MSGKNQKVKSLANVLKAYEKDYGWVAIDKKNNIVAWAEEFSEIMEIISSDDLTALPLSNDYFGFVTACLI